jgi:hypothetical protein
MRSPTEQKKMSSHKPNPKKRGKPGEDKPAAPVKGVVKSISITDVLAGPREGFLLSHAATTAGAASDVDLLAAAVRADCGYVDAMVALVPVDYYVPKTDDEIETTWSKYHVVRGRRWQHGCGWWARALLGRGGGSVLHWAARWRPGAWCPQS